MNKTQRNLLIGSAVVVALASTAAASVYFTRESKLEPIKVASVQRAPAQQQAATAQPEAQPCDDGNAAGIVLGGAGGALAGNQFGKGSGKTAATLAGAAGGAYLGQEYLPTRGALCK